MDEKNLYLQLIESLAEGNVLKFGQIIESLSDGAKRDHPIRHQCFQELHSLIIDLDKFKDDNFGMTVDSISKRSFDLLKKMVEGDGLTSENMRPFFLALAAFLEIIISKYKTQLVALQFFSQAFFQTDEGKRYVQALSFLQTPGTTGFGNVPIDGSSSKLKH